jgi:hypothetical protein
MNGLEKRHGFTRIPSAKSMESMAFLFLLHEALP